MYIYLSQNVLLKNHITDQLFFVRELGYYKTQALSFLLLI